MYKFSQSNEIEFLAWRTWIGIWTLVIALVVAFFQVNYFWNSFIFTLNFLFRSKKYHFIPASRFRFIFCGFFCYRDFYFVCSFSVKMQVELYLNLKQTKKVKTSYKQIVIYDNTRQLHKQIYYIVHTSELIFFCSTWNFLHVVTIHLFVVEIFWIFWVIFHPYPLVTGSIRKKTFLIVWNDPDISDRLKWRTFKGMRE